MKLNNKGFAITAVLYGLLILFVLLVSSYLLVLSSRKNRIDNLVESIEEEYFLSIDNETSTNEANETDETNEADEVNETEEINETNEIEEVENTD